MSIIFWLGIFANSIEAQEINFTINFWIIIGVLIWGIILSSIIALGSSFVNERIMTLITRSSGILLILFGVKYVYNILRLLVT